jgi:NTE family protein
MGITVFFLALCISVFSAGVLPAEERAAEAKPPKIALVLSGGAALGFAHVGFLKVLEETGIPVDIVIGNSMGSLIGGLYAAGYSPGDIEKTASEINWAQVFLNEGADRTENLLEERQRPFFTLAFDREGTGRSKGILPDQNITLLLSRLVYRVAAREHFSDLPLPFKTLAVDIAGGRVLPLQSGPLYRAMRASMSIPLVFPPVPMRETYLVDGGILDNNPIDLALEWGADIIIDVDVGSFAARAPEELGTLETVTDQTVRLIQSASIMSNLASGREDFRLDMDLSDFFWTDFAKARQLIDRGEQLSRSVENIKALLALAEKIEKTRPLEKRNWKRRGIYQELPVPVFTGVRLVSIGVNGKTEDAETYQKEFSAKYLASLFDVFFNTPADFTKLESAIEIIRRRGNYESAGYHLEDYTDEEGGAGCRLVITGVRAQERNNDFSLGLRASYAWGEQTHLGINESVDVNFHNIFFPDSLLTLHFSYDFSDTQGPGGAVAFTRQLSSLFSLQVTVDGAYYVSTIQAFQPEGELSSFGFVNAGTHLVFSPDTLFNIALSYRYAPFWYNHETLPSYYEGRHLAALSIGVDTVNVSRPLYFDFLYNLMWRFSIEFPLTGWDTRHWYERFEWYAQKVWLPRSNRNFISDVTAASYRGDLESRWTFFSPAGKTGIPGYSGDSLLGRDKFLIGITYLEEITPLSNLLSLRSFFAATVRGGNIWKRFETILDAGNWRGGLRAGFQIETPVGAVFFGPECSFDGRLQFCIYYN